ncbi:methyltransferase [Longispora fulva]|uniref:SAM-dependent methyltransferase n=1 Tax=Longispora fulva TaxID=619741 RepID=A0A8J7GEX8_9ACTN|nr:methyltransferase [Longispora fulva]MBG6136645.1 SAM-dependent methyltransferase [Longispora fulva]GIG59814.1 methyltransferase [Longispora fulva]
MTAPRGQLLTILQGTWIAQACYALAKLEIPDLLADGPRPAADLAEECGADPQALHRLLRVLVYLGLLAQPAPDTFALTEVTALMRRDIPGSMHGTALIYGEDVFRCFAEVMHPLLHGRPGFEKVAGKPIYDYLNDNAEAARTWNESMSRNRIPEILASCDLTEAKVVVDVGGGTGRLLAQLLATHPHLRGVLQELPTAVEQARELFVDAGLADRVDLVAGSFFDTVPEGGDTYILARCLHNWNDEHALTILRRVRDAMGPCARLLVLEDLTTDDVSLVDLVMLVQHEGHDRTEEQYRALLDAAGFQVMRTRRLEGGDPHAEGVIEAVPNTLAGHWWPA